MHTVNTEYLRWLKDESKMTTQQIAEASNVPQGTIARILNGETQNPSFSNVADIIYAMGGSIDEMVGEQKEGKNPRVLTVSDANSSLEIALKNSKDSFNNALNRTEAVYESQIECMKATISVKDHWLRRMFLYCCVLTAILTILSLWRF